MSEITENLPRDASRKDIQAAKGFQTEDASDTPKESPLTVSDSILELVIPNNAVTVTLSAPNAALRFSEKSDASSSFPIPKGGSETVGIAGGSSIYVVRDGATDVQLGFKFNYI